MVRSEEQRNLFSTKGGFRKHAFFSSHGTDNVHLNHNGVIRLARYLKYKAHLTNS